MWTIKSSLNWHVALFLPDEIFRDGNEISDVKNHHSHEHGTILFQIVQSSRFIQTKSLIFLVFYCESYWVSNTWIINKTKFIIFFYETFNL